MQITKAMELVASSKLRRAKERALKTRTYFELLKVTLDDIASANKDFSSEFTQKRIVHKKCFVVIAGDRGLAGGYNAGVLKSVEKCADKSDYIVLPIGKKTGEYFTHRKIELVCENYLIAEDVSMADCSRMGDMLSEMYKKGEFDELYVVYTKFVSVLTQQPQISKVLPITTANENSKDKKTIIYDPGAEEVFDLIVPSYISGMIYGGLCEAQASEFAARRTAMESATKSATEMIDSLSLKYNRARQAAITQEITEIVSGAEAL